MNLKIKIFEKKPFKIFLSSLLYAKMILLVDYFKEFENKHYY